MLALRYAWHVGEIVDLSLLICPPVAPRYPRQVFWQRDLCESGVHFVRGAQRLPMFFRGALICVCVHSHAIPSHS
jgi:hypothetical protein